jgi:hypothetical protein
MVWNEEQLICIVGDRDGGATAALLGQLLSRCGVTATLLDGRSCPSTDVLWAQILSIKSNICVLSLTEAQVAYGWLLRLPCTMATLCSVEEETDCPGLASGLVGCGRLAANLDEAPVRLVAEHSGLPCFGYAERRSDAALNGRNLMLRPDSLTFEALTDNAIARIKLPRPGSYGLYAGLGALACGLLLGLSLETMAAQTAEVAALPEAPTLLRRENGADLLLYQGVDPADLEGALLEGQSLTRGRVLLVLALPPRRRLTAPLRQIALGNADWCAVSGGAGRGWYRLTPQAALRAALLTGETGDLILCTGQVDWKDLLSTALVGAAQLI